MACSKSVANDAVLFKRRAKASPPLTTFMLVAAEKSAKQFILQSMPGNPHV
jgi:hypothetical protein